MQSDSELYRKNFLIINTRKKEEGKKQSKVINFLVSKNFWISLDYKVIHTVKIETEQRVRG